MNLCEVERAAGVAVLSGVIQVSVRARNCSDLREAWAEMNSGMSFLVAAWQFHRPPSTTMWWLGERIGYMRLEGFL